MMRDRILIPASILVLALAFVLGCGGDSGGTKLVDPGGWDQLNLRAGIWRFNFVGDAGGSPACDTRPLLVDTVIDTLCSLSGDDVAGGTEELGTCVAGKDGNTLTLSCTADSTVAGCTFTQTATGTLTSTDDRHVKIVFQVSYASDDSSAACANAHPCSLTVTINGTWQGEYAGCASTGPVDGEAMLALMKARGLAAIE